MRTMLPSALALLSLIGCSADVPLPEVEATALAQRQPLVGDISPDYALSWDIRALQPVTAIAGTPFEGRLASIWPVRNAFGDGRDGLALEAEIVPYGDVILTLGAPSRADDPAPLDGLYARDQTLPIGDFDGDGREDLAWPVMTAFDGDSETRGLRFDFDSFADGLTDVAADGGWNVDFDGQNNHLFPNAVGDVTGDGYEDLLLVSTGRQGARLLRGQPDLGHRDDWWQQPEILVGSEVPKLSPGNVGDLDGDGTNDLVLGGYNEVEVGGHTWTVPGPFAQVFSAAGDFDRRTGSDALLTVFGALQMRATGAFDAQGRPLVLCLLAQTEGFTPSLLALPASGLHHAEDLVVARLDAAFDVWETQIVDFDGDGEVDLLSGSVDGWSEAESSYRWTKDLVYGPLEGRVARGETLVADAQFRGDDHTRQATALDWDGDGYTDLAILGETSIGWIRGGPREGADEAGEASIDEPSDEPSDEPADEPADEPTDDEDPAPGDLFPHPGPNDLVITEILANPIYDERCSEWFEVAVDAPDAVFQLGGLEVWDDGGHLGVVEGSLIVETGDIVVLGRSNADDWCDPGVLPQAFYGGQPALNNAGDGVQLINADGELVDRSAVWNDAESGVSWELSTAGWDGNDDAGSWVDATEPYGDGEQWGTPGF